MNARITFYIMLVLLILTIGGGAFGYYFTSGILDKNSQQFADKQLELNSVSNHVAYLQKLQQQTIDLESQLGDLTKIYPEQKQQAQIVDQLLKLADKRGVTISENRIAFPTTETVPSKNSQLSESTVVSGLYGMKAQLDVSGSFKNTLAFLKDIENFRRVINVSTIEMQSDGNTVTSAIELEILVQQAPKQPKKKTGSSQSNASGTQDSNNASGTPN